MTKSFSGQEYGELCNALTANKYNSFVKSFNGSFDFVRQKLILLKDDYSIIKTFFKSLENCNIFKHERSVDKIIYKLISLLPETVKETYLDFLKTNQNKISENPSENEFIINCIEKYYNFFGTFKTTIIKTPEISEDDTQPIDDDSTDPILEDNLSVSTTEEVEEESDMDLSGESSMDQ